MGTIREHLTSPQFKDAQGEATTRNYGPGLMVGVGRPRWVGYTLFLVVALIGVAMILGVVDLAGDLRVILGALLLGAAVLGMTEVFRGKPLWRR